MRRLRVGVIAGVALAVGWVGDVRGEKIDAALTTTERRELMREGRVVVELLQNVHYSNRQFHEIESKEIIDHFIQRLDPERLIFTAEDARTIHRRFDRSLKTVYLLKGDVQPAFEIADRFRAKAAVRLQWVNAWFDAGADLSVDEVHTVSDVKALSDDDQALDRRWALRLKNAVIQEIVRGRDPNGAAAVVRRSFERWGKQVEGLNALGVREEFLEALITLFDPHSGYSGPEGAEEFQIMMRGAVAGVGLDVWMDEGKCLVAGVTRGGPAERQGDLRAGDEILALAEADGSWVEVKGRRLQGIVTTLRGVTGTKLRVAYRSPGDEGRREVTLERREVILVDQRARGGISEVPRENGAMRKIGWIDLPDFYAAGVDSSESSATRDVRELIEQMKAKAVEGIVVDLRRNPGGAMTEAIALTGLFIPSGPVMVTSAMDGKQTVHPVPPGQPQFDGPLVVLLSPQSASASEIFAGALRYHRRAVLVGASSTFGKGTAQSYIDLNQNPMRAGGALPWGMLRVTGQRFYWPDGHSPQGQGAKSDIVFSYSEDPEAEREANLPHALTAGTITTTGLAPADGGFVRITEAELGYLRTRVTARIAAWPEWDLKRRSYEAEMRGAAQKEFSLHVARRLEEETAREAEANSLGRDLRAAGSLAYRNEDLEIEAVRQVTAEHHSLARRWLESEGISKAGWLHGNIFYLEDDSGGINEARLERMDFRRYADDTRELAEAFTRSSGLGISAGAMASVLRELTLIERMSDAAVLACFANAVSAEAKGKSDDPHLKRGVEAVLKRIVEIDPALLRMRPIIDVGLRESLRVAADWADRLSDGAITEKEPAVNTLVSR